MKIEMLFLEKWNSHPTNTQAWRLSLPPKLILLQIYPATVAKAMSAMKFQTLIRSIGTIMAFW